MRRDASEVPEKASTAFAASRTITAQAAKIKRFLVIGFIGGSLLEKV